MFYDKRWNLNGLKTMIKRVVSTGTIEPQETHVHFSCSSYLIITLTEVRDVFMSCTLPRDSWLDLQRSLCWQAQISIFHSKSKQMYQRIFIPQLNNIFNQLKSEFTQLHLLKLLCKFDHFPGRYRRKQKLAFFY